MANFCRYCGTQLEENMDFCKQCGKPVRKIARPKGGQDGRSPNPSSRQGRQPYGTPDSGYRNPRNRAWESGERQDFRNNWENGERQDFRNNWENGERQDPRDSWADGGRQDFGDNWGTGGGQDPRDDWEDSRRQDFRQEQESRKRKKKAKRRDPQDFKRKKKRNQGLPKSLIPLGALFAVVGVILIVLLVLFAVAKTGDKVDTSSPEQVAGSFFDKLQDQDLEGALACFSCEEASENFNYESYVKAFDEESQDTLLPTEDKKAKALNRQKLEGQAADQISSVLRVIGLGEESGRLSVQGVSPWKKLGVGTEEYIENVDSRNLKDLKVERVELAAQSRQDQEETQDDLNAQAKAYGADERREYVALYTVGETSYIQGLTIDRYGDEWKIFSLTSDLAGLSSYGTPDVAEKSLEFDSYIK